MTTDFVVVGGGIGGAVLASLLGRGGKKVVVLERSLAPPRLVRPEILWPGTMELLSSLRPQEFWERDAVLAMRGVEFQDGGRAQPFITADVLRDAQVQPWFTDPAETREQLLRLDSFELRRGVEVIAILKEKSRIVGVRTRDTATREEGEVLAGYTVGDDGAQSIVRKAFGIDMQNSVFPVEFFCFGCDWPAAVPSATARFWLNSGRQASGIIGLGIMPFPNGKGAGLVPVLPQAFDANASVEASWNQFCAVDPTLREVLRGRQFPVDFVRIRPALGPRAALRSGGSNSDGRCRAPGQPGGRPRRQHVGRRCPRAGRTGLG